VSNLVVTESVRKKSLNNKRDNLPTQGGYTPRIKNFNTTEAA